MATGKGDREKGDKSADCSETSRDVNANKVRLVRSTCNSQTNLGTRDPSFSISRTCRRGKRSRSRSTWKRSNLNLIKSAAGNLDREREREKERETANSRSRKKSTPIRRLFISRVQRGYNRRVTEIIHFRDNFRER